MWSTATLPCDLLLITVFVTSLAREVRTTVMSMSVCWSVCPFAYLENHTADIHQIFCACRLWTWLDPPLAASRYLLYFRFCGWRHVFTQWAIRCVMRIPIGDGSVSAETAASILTEFLTTINISKYTIIVSCSPGATSAIYNCLVSDYHLFPYTHIPRWSVAGHLRCDVCIHSFIYSPNAIKTKHNKITQLGMTTRQRICTYRSHKIIIK